MTYKDRMVDNATEIISEIYDAPKEQLRNVWSRKRHIMEARRMLIFYLNKFLDIKHLHMKRYIKGLCHATSIHHCRKMEFFILYDKTTIKAYEQFQERMNLIDIRNELIKVKQETIVRLQAEVNDYFKNKQND